MSIVMIACALLIVSSTVLHYEALRALNAALPSLCIPNRTKLLVVMVGSFLAHAAEIAMYGAAFYFFVRYLDKGSLSGAARLSVAHCMYFSAETYTSLGFGDLTPTGPVRLLAGAEALNGLLLIGWSASFTYLSMERFWNVTPSPSREENEIAR